MFGVKVNSPKGRHEKHCQSIIMRFEDVNDQLTTRLPHVDAEETTLTLNESK